MRIQAFNIRTQHKSTVQYNFTGAIIKFSCWERKLVSEMCDSVGVERVRTVQYNFMAFLHSHYHSE